MRTKESRRRRHEGTLRLRFYTQKGEAAAAGGGQTQAVCLVPEAAAAVVQY